MTRRTDRLFAALHKFLIAACVVATFLALAACSCRDWGYCPPTLAPRADQ